MHLRGYYFWSCAILLLWYLKSQFQYDIHMISLTYLKDTCFNCISLEKGQRNNSITEVLRSPKVCVAEYLSLLDNETQMLLTWSSLRSNTQIPSQFISPDRWATDATFLFNSIENLFMGQWINFYSWVKSNQLCRDKCNQAIQEWKTLRKLGATDGSLCRKSASCVQHITECIHL